MADYRSANPFFTEEDDDDFGFSKPRPGAPGEDEWAVPERPLTREEQIQQMKDNSRNRQLESTQRALSSMYDSERMGVATAEELVQQGEQLDNVERKLDSMDGDLKTSQRHLNNIKSIFGGIKNWWTSKKEIKEEEEQKGTGDAQSDKLQAALERDRMENQGGQHPALRLRSEDGRGFYTDDSGFSSGGASGGYSGSSSSYSSSSYSKQASSTKPSAYDQQLDSNIDMMSSGMSRLKGLAVGLGDEIERQNAQIDRIAPKTDRLDASIQDKNQQMRGILGK